MRILHMIPDIGVANGIMSVILNFARSMPEEIKFDIVYFHETEKTRKAEIEALGGSVYKIPKPPAANEIKRLFAAHAGEWAALHIHAPHFALFMAPAAKKAGIKKICVHCHSTEFSLKGNGRRNQLLSLYAKYFIRDKFACSALAGDYWYGAQPYTVIHNAIDCSAFSFNETVRAEIRTKLGMKNGLIVGHIGRTDIPQKNHGFLLSIFREIVKRNATAALLLIGAEKTDELARQCDEYGITDRVHFLGLRDDVPDLLRACDVFLFPSTREGLPVSLIEAQAAGLPVLMSDSVSAEASVTDLVHTLGLSESPEIWAEACLRFAELPKRDTLAEMTDAGWDLCCVREQLTDYYTR